MRSLPRTAALDLDPQDVRPLPAGMNAAAGRAEALVALDAAMLGSTLRIRAALGLTAAEWLVMLVVITAAVQRYMRAPDADPRFRDATPLPPQLVGRTSRRRVADVSEVPLETVRRIVARLIDRRLIQEEEDGLHGMTGMVARFAEAGWLQDTLAGFAHAWNGAGGSVGRLRTDARLVAYHLANTGLELQLSLARQYGLPPATLELFLQLLLRPAPPAGERNAARALGLPRETFRRRLSRLAARGLVLDSPCGPMVPPDVRARHSVYAEALERLRLLNALQRALALREDALRATPAELPTI